MHSHCSDFLITGTRRVATTHQISDFPGVCVLEHASMVGKLGRVVGFVAATARRVAPTLHSTSFLLRHIFRNIYILFRIM